eukprot:scaffold1659_cov255-Pinguiococcus_pyrenoidosus.AAC.41
MARYCTSLALAGTLIPCARDLGQGIVWAGFQSSGTGLTSSEQASPPGAASQAVAAGPKSALEIAWRHCGALPLPSSICPATWRL